MVGWLMNERRRVFPTLELTIVVPVLVLTLIGSPTVVYIAQIIIGR